MGKGGWSNGVGTGKRERADGIEEQPPARVSQTPEKLRQALASEETIREELFEDLTFTQLEDDNDVFEHNQQYTILDVYSIACAERENLFRYDITILNQGKPAVRTRAIFDSGASINAMCSRQFEKVKNRIREWKPSSMPLRVANGQMIRAKAMWRASSSRRSRRARVICGI